MSKRTAQSVQIREKPSDANSADSIVTISGMTAGRVVTGSTTSATSSHNSTVIPPESDRSKEFDEIKRAVLAHIRAVRALGRTEINTLEIAAALSLSVQKVNEVLSELGAHGVRRR